MRWAVRAQSAKRARQELSEPNTEAREWSHDLISALYAHGAIYPHFRVWRAAPSGRKMAGSYVRKSWQGSPAPRLSTVSSSV